jgi:hypothetical protein
MTPAEAVAVYDAGWSDEALLHSIAVCAYFNNMNRWWKVPGSSAPPRNTP